MTHAVLGVLTEDVRMHVPNRNRIRIDHLSRPRPRLGCAYSCALFRTAPGSLRKLIAPSVDLLTYLLASRTSNKISYVAWVASSYVSLCATLASAVLRGSPYCYPCMDTLCTHRGRAFARARAHQVTFPVRRFQRRRKRVRVRVNAR